MCAQHVSRSHYNLYHEDIYLKVHENQVEVQKQRQSIVMVIDLSSISEDCNVHTQNICTKRQEICNVIVINTRHESMFSESSQ